MILRWFNTLVNQHDFQSIIIRNGMGIEWLFEGFGYTFLFNAASAASLVSKMTKA